MMDPNKETYSNSGELFEEVIGNLYGTSDDDEDIEEEDTE